MKKQTKEKLKKMMIFNEGQTGGVQLLITGAFSLVAIIMVIFLSLVFYNLFSDRVVKIKTESSEQFLNQTKHSLEDYLRNNRRISDALYYSSIKNFDITKDNIDDEMNLIYEANKDNIISISLYDDEGRLLSAVPVVNKVKKEEIIRKDWYQNAVKEVENLHFSMPYVKNISDEALDGYRWVVSLSRAVELNQGNSPEHGVLVIDIKYIMIQQMLEKVNSDDSSEYIYLCDSEGNIIYHPKRLLMNAGLYQEDTSRITSAADGASIQKMNGEEYIVVVKTISYTGWKLISVVPNNGYQVGQDKMQYLLIFFICITILGIFLINQQMSRSITRPLIELDSAIHDVENDSINPEIYKNAPGEIVHLGETLQSYMSRNKLLMQTIVEEQELKRKSELDALQSQINPHFLYNTLDSVIWMIEDDQNAGAVYMIKELSKLLRISINKGRSLITIRDEIRHAESYINIQQVRYKNQFTCSFKVDEDILDCCTIKLIVQPLLENAINYGVQGMDDDGEIIVRGFRSEDYICLDVIDNGCGMSKEQINRIFTEKSSFTEGSLKRGNGVGLKNVNTRIKMQFGDEYGIEIESELEEGTRMRLKLPYILYSSMSHVSEGEV